MKKIKTLLEMTAFVITVPLLILSEFTCPKNNRHPNIPVVAAPGIFHKDVTAVNHDQPMPALLNSKFIIINY